MNSHRLCVEKIGGSSMSRFPEIIKNVILYRPENIYGRIYIVSAYADITNDLLEHKKTGQPGIYRLFQNQENYPIKMLALRERLFKINETFVEAGLNLEEANNFIGDRIDQAINILRSMDNVLASGYVTREELLLAARELLASLGEMHSAYNSADILKNKGYNTTYVDLSGWDDSRQLTIDERIKNSFTNIDPFSTICFATGYVTREELLLAARELLASLGEMHSAYNSADILKNKGYNTTYVDLSGWDDSRQLTIDERIKNSFTNIDPFSTICFATGYTKGTEGIMREFDRGYSEVTFSKVAVLLGASEAIIHKEYHLCSGDPLIMGEENTKPVCNTNYDVADQLADVGMEAIHPKASKPLEIKSTPIRVKNAFDPGHPGTLITRDYIAPESKVEIVTGSNHVLCLEIHDTRMVGEVGFDLRIMHVFINHRVSYISKMTNANTIDFIIEEKDCSSNLVAELDQHFEEVYTKKVAIVCAIGSNIGQPGIMAKAAHSLARDGINILAVSQTTRQTNMQFIVERDQFAQAQRALHAALCR